MRFLNWRKEADGVVRIIVQRTPERWFFKWYTTGERRYSKRELLDINMRVVKFVNRLPVEGRKLESHTLSLWV